MGSWADAYGQPNISEGNVFVGDTVGRFNFDLTRTSVM